MKILMLNNEFPPLGGGTGTVNLELFNYFQKDKEIHIDLITSAIGKRKEIEQFADNITIYKYPVRNKNIHHSSNRELISYFFQALFASIKLQRKNKYDFCMTWSTVPAGIMARILKIVTGLTYFVRISGPDIPNWEERYKFIYKLITPFIKNAWKNSKFIVVKCEQEKEAVININSKLNILTIHNGIDCNKFNIKEHNFNRKSLHLICVSRLIKRKGQDILIKAVKQLQDKGFDCTVDFVGDGDDFDNLKLLSDSLKISEKVTFKGYIPRSEISNLYRQADIFVLPSYNEGMSNALLEAMASGLPVIVTNTGGTKELVKEFYNGLIFKAGNINELTEKIEYFFSNQFAVKEMGKNSRIIAEQHSWENVAMKYVSLFKN